MVGIAGMTMRTEEWNVTVGDGKEQRKLLVKVEADQGGEYRLRIGNEITTVQLALKRVVTLSSSKAVGPRARRVTRVDGSAALTSTGSLPDLKLTIDGGDPIAVSVVDAQSLETSAGTATLVGEIRAAMPGKVVKVLCKVGDVVQLGQPLFDHRGHEDGKRATRRRWWQGRVDCRPRRSDRRGRPGSAGAGRYVMSRRTAR